MKKGSREFIDDEIIWTRRGVKIIYTGRRLDESDADLWMQLLHYNRNKPLSEKIELSRAKLLKDLGKSNGSKSYKWLDAAIRRLGGSIIIETKRYIFSEVLLQSYSLDKKKGKYYFQISNEIAKLFTNSEFSLIKAKNRHRLKYDLSKSLQRHIATSSTTRQSFQYKDLLKRLKRKTEIRYLKRDLKKVCKDLEDQKIIVNHEIKADKLIIWRTKITS
ncbi:MAG: plasmid replication initiator TrfA [Cocleimonas sp.]